MKRAFTVLLTLVCLFSFASCIKITVRPAEETSSETAVEPSPETDLTSAHGWFDPDDHAEILFRGQRYYNACTSGALILDKRMEGVAYITSEDITDDKEAEKEGAVVYFDAEQEIPDILMMPTEDYFKGEDYDKDYYYEYTYFCKKEKWGTFGQKLRTQAFKSIYVSSIDVVGSMTFGDLAAKPELLDDDTAAAIKRTVHQDTDDYLDISEIESRDFRVLVASKCDKNMLIDPQDDEYLIFEVDGEYYICDWYTPGCFRVPQEDKALIEAMMEKYSFTVDVFTDYYKESIADPPSGSPDSRVSPGENYL